MYDLTSEIVAIKSSPLNKTMKEEQTDEEDVYLILKSELQTVSSKAYIEN